MKITYPECQIEITAEEIIYLLNHFDESTSSRKHEITKESDNPKEQPAPTFEPGGFVPNDEQPAPKPYPSLTDHEAIVHRGEGLEYLIMQSLKEAEAQGKLPEVQIPTEEAPAESPSNSHVESTISRKDEIPKEEPAPAESKKEPAKQKRKTNSKKVQVLFETGWKTFNSISQAAKAIDARLNHLSHALLNGKTCNGHQVRYANPELDASLAEIQERNKQPYQPSKPVR